MESAVKQITPQQRAGRQLTELERQVTHAVKQSLRMFPVYHAAWVIMIEQKTPHQLRVMAFLPENTTLPDNLRRPEQPITFNHTSSHEMKEFTDVMFFPIARELAKNMTKAFQQGAAYRRI